MSATAQVIALVAITVGSLVAAPDLHWAVVSLAWSLLGWLAGIGCGWLLWGRRKDIE